MPSAVASHSHRATTKVNNKAFKSRKATKGAMRDQLKGKMSHPGRSYRTCRIGSYVPCTCIYNFMIPLQAAGETQDHFANFGLTTSS